MPTPTPSSLTSDVLHDMTERAKQGTLTPDHLRWVFGHVQTSRPRVVAREGMGIHPLLMEADINGATLVKVYRTATGFEQWFRSPWLAAATEPCAVSPETMVGELQVPATKWTDETERFLTVLANGTDAETFSVVVVVRTRTRLATWWVVYDRTEGLTAMLVPARGIAPLP